MGATESKQKLGERVIIAQKKLSEDVKAQNDRATQLMAKSPQTMQFLLERMAASFKSHAAFLEATLLIAYKADPVKCRGFILDACRKVLSAPIQKEEYEWFKGYVLPSSVWMLKTRQDRFMYQDLLDVVNEQSAHIVSSMDSVYAHLKTHSKWNELIAIENQNIVDRQDDPQVALLKDAGIQNFAIAEMKNDVDNEDAEDAMEQMKSFVDSHVAITSLTVTAKRVDKEFQNYVQSVMGHLGHFKPGPLKKVERCLSKLENDYHSEVYPKSAKLFDLVRCSVTFNTLEQLLIGYEALMQHMQKDNQTSLKLARVKNGFLDDEYDGGYRDIKVNVIFNSSMHADTRMVVEVQLILNQYLTEKQRIHKLYSIAREQTFFDLVVSAENKDLQFTPASDFKDLQFTPALNVGTDVSLKCDAKRKKNAKKKAMYKCSIDVETGLLGMEGSNWFGIVDVNRKTSVQEFERETGNFACHTHQWLTINKERYVSVQMNATEIKMFKKTGHEFVEDARYTITHRNDLAHFPLINYCKFDQNFENIYVMTDYHAVQRRPMSNVSEIARRIVLPKPVESSDIDNFELSSDGSLCAIAGGTGKSYFYTVDVDNEKQHKFSTGNSNSFSSSGIHGIHGINAPCFINGGTKQIALGGALGNVYVFDMAKQQIIQEWKLHEDRDPLITASASMHNILAIGAEDKWLRLYDVRNWQCFHKSKYKIKGYSLQITDDLKHLIYAGRGVDQCLVLKIGAGKSLK